MSYVTPYRYARLCGVSPQYIYQRLAAGTLQKHTQPQPNGTVRVFIDTEAYPPERLRKKSEK